MPIVEEFPAGPGHTVPGHFAFARTERFRDAETEGTLVKVDSRAESRILILRRATPFDDGRLIQTVVPTLLDILLQCVHEARLPQTCLADNQDHLAHTLFGLFPTILQQVDLIISASQRRQARAFRRIDRAVRLQHCLHMEQLHRLSSSFDFAEAKAGALEATSDQTVGGCGADNFARYGHFVEPDSDVRCFSYQ
jgi:hypothetical protein